jgi:hypothetical protein
MAFSQEFEGECLEIIHGINQNNSAPNPSKQGHLQNNLTFSQELPQFRVSSVDEDCIIQPESMEEDHPSISGNLLLEQL